MERKGLAYLRRKLAQKETRVKLRYQWYEMKNTARDFDISTPPSLKHWMATLGWCAKAVDSMADRLVFREFRDDPFDLNGIFQKNNPDVFFDSAILSALIASCCFVYLSADEQGTPRLQVIDGGSATGIVDPITGMLTEGYAVLERDPETGTPLVEAYFMPEATEIYRGSRVVMRHDHVVAHPLLVPIIYRPDAVRPFGHSRISRACMAIQGSAMRTAKRSEISAEFYSFPQRWVTGLSEDAEQMDKWRASMSSLITFTKDEEGEKPSLGQFTQQSMAPHVEQLRMFAGLFAAETGLTLEDLGMPADNPSSSEAIRASHENLRLACRKAQRSFGSGFLNVGFLAACLRDKSPYQRSQLVHMQPVWEPIFEPDLNAMAMVGDAALKINQAVPGFMTGNTLQDMTGIRPAGGTDA